MELPCATIEEIQDRAYMCVILFTGMRTRDVHSVKSKNVIFVACTVETCPRHIDFRLDTSKNDRAGEGSKTNLTYSLRELFTYISFHIESLISLYYLLACVCLQNLTGRAKGSFLALCKSNNDAACIGPCPYAAVKCYYDLCPDNTGAEAAYVKDPIFMRAKQQQGVFSSHRFLLSPMGEHTIRNIPARVNLRLPEELQVEGITGHSGRKSFVTNALDEGCSQAVVAQASKHKDPRMLERYHAPSKTSLLTPALAIGEGLIVDEDSSSRKRQRFDDEEKEESKRSDSVNISERVNSQTTIVKNYYINL
jgi:hypothetical protein